MLYLYKISLLVWPDDYNSVGSYRLGLEVASSVLREVRWKKGVCNKAYVQQVLEAVIFPYYDSLNEAPKKESIFIEDGSKVHKGNASLPKLQKGIWGFD